MPDGGVYCGCGQCRNYNSEQRFCSRRQRSGGHGGWFHGVGVEKRRFYAPVGAEPRRRATLVVYAKGSVTVAGGDIAKIVFTLNGVSNARRYALFTPDTGALQPAQSAGDTEISWEGDAQSVTFTVGDYASMGTDGSHKAGQIHVVSVEIHGSAGSGGVAGIIVDEDGTPAEYFTMQGVRVYHPVRGGLYIRRQEGRASKVFVKATDPI